MKCKKVKYSSENEALLALNKIKNESKRKIVPIRIYHCHCNAWHLTSRLDVKDIQEENEKLREELSELKYKHLELENKIFDIINNPDPKLSLILKKDMTLEYKIWELRKLKERLSKLEEENIYLLDKVASLQRKLKVK